MLSIQVLLRFEGIHKYADFFTQKSTSGKKIVKTMKPLVEVKTPDLDA